MNNKKEETSVIDNPEMTIEEFKKLKEEDQEWVAYLCMKRCNKFFECNSPRCPLDPRIDIRLKLRGEAECSSPKSKRIEKAKGLPLASGGLTKKEFAGHLVWKGNGEETKNKIIGQLKKKEKKS